MNDGEPLAWSGSDRVIVAMPEEIDANNAAQVREWLNLALLRGVALVIADLSGTRFCDSSGVSELAQAHRRAVDMNVELRATAGAATVLRVFELAGLDQILPVYTSLDAALADRPVSNDAA